MAYRFSIRDLFVFFFMAFCFALPFSLYAISVSMFGMAACALFEDTAGGIRLNIRWKAHLQRLWQNRAGCYGIAFYLLYALSVLWSSETGYWLHHLRLLAPLVVFPLVFAVHGGFDRTRWQLVMASSQLSMAIQLSLVLLNYFSHYDAINLGILQSKPVPTPISHIRFSLLLACDLLVLFHFLVEGPWVRFRGDRWLYGGLFAYFFAGLHILSVKSGLAGFYLGLTACIAVYLIRRNRAMHLSWILPSLVLLFAILVWSIPSLNNKYHYLTWQLGEWARGKYRWYSDIERWQSIAFGWELILRHPLTGTGIGDLPKEMAGIYLEKIGSTDVKNPHNQFIFTWAACGLPALWSLLMMCYHGIFRNIPKKALLACGTGVAVCFSLLVENGLGTSAGVGLFVWMLTLQNEFDGASGKG